MTYVEKEFIVINNFQNKPILNNKPGKRMSDISLNLKQKLCNICILEDKFKGLSSFRGLFNSKYLLSKLGHVRCLNSTI